MLVTLLEVRSLRLPLHSPFSRKETQIYLCQNVRDDEFLQVPGSQTYENSSLLPSVCVMWDTQDKKQSWQVGRHPLELKLLDLDHSAPPSPSWKISHSSKTFSSFVFCALHTHKHTHTHTHAHFTALLWFYVVLMGQYFLHHVSENCNHFSKLYIFIMAPVTGWDILLTYYMLSSKLMC